MNTLHATADELDALAFGLSGAPFPDTGPTLVAAAPEEHRGLVAARLLRSLALRGVVVDGPHGPAVAPVFQPLLHCRLAAQVTVIVRVRTPGSSAMAAVCECDGSIVVHSADPDGVHHLREVRLPLLDAVLAQLDPPPLAKPGDRPLRMRYSELDSADNPFVSAVRDYSYAAKIIKISVEMATAALVVGRSGQAWLASVEPDGDGLDGRLYARPVGQLREAVASVLTGSPSHSVAGQ
ncbi:hypothetical protein Rhe02_65900 [Rhizocola hellebori]|uniref:ESX secretion-associated protein EspG n=1 Tax=Rhizocola hellebori TaxID=1392758 RepID=A0A8J3QCT7_9ACTN|nr:hypothetical protein [Rhizocola hellebori]GIH08523.1 hypothetical protein Rhe02_65900 [Rhizocola hellebori]